MRTLLFALTLVVATVAVASLSTAADVQVSQPIPCTTDPWWHLCTNVPADPGECAADYALQATGGAVCNTGAPTSCTAWASAGAGASCNNGDKAWAVLCQMCAPTFGVACTVDLHGTEPSCNARGTEPVDSLVSWG